MGRSVSPSSATRPAAAFPERRDLAAHEPLGEFSLIDDLEEELDEPGTEGVEAGRELRAHSARRQQRRAARLHRPIMALPLTPLIDVVFQLLVFFLLATDFSGPEEIFQVDLPQAASGADTASGSDSPRTAPDPFRLDRQPVRVLVTSTGPGADDYVVEVVGANEDLAGFGGLEAFLRRHLVLPGTQRGLYLPDHPVVLEPSPATSWDHAVGAFNAAVRAGCTNVVFRGAVVTGPAAGPAR